MQQTDGQHYFVHAGTIHASAEAEILRLVHYHHGVGMGRDLFRRPAPVKRQFGVYEGEIDGAAVDDDFTMMTDTGPVYDPVADRVARTLGGVERPIAEIRARLERKAAERRKAYLIGGFRLPNGLAVRTTAENRELLDRARRSADAGRVDPVNWKGSVNGDRRFTDLDAASIIEIDTAVTAHIESAFDYEKPVFDAIMDPAATVADLRAVDLTAIPDPILPEEERN